MCACFEDLIQIDISNDVLIRAFFFCITLMSCDRHLTCFISMVNISAKEATGTATCTEKKAWKIPNKKQKDVSISFLFLLHARSVSDIIHTGLVTAWSFTFTFYFYRFISSLELILSGESSVIQNWMLLNYSEETENESQAFKWTVVFVRSGCRM